MDHVALPGTTAAEGLLPSLDQFVSKADVAAGGQQLGEALWKVVSERYSSKQAAVESYLLLITTLAPTQIAPSCVPPSPSIEEGLWQHESMRLYICGLNKLVVHLAGVCTPKSCPKMTASSEWLFLCACHKQPQECPAVDYAFHTLDGAAIVLHSTKFFSDKKETPERSPQQLFANMIRRLYRIFAHAWHHHNKAFMEFENRYKLCERFVMFSFHFSLLQKDNILMPYPEER
eukprot:Rhum_TRINITY_DN12755_c0_g1::Rhum_TRINITY_DN12755_c0_g1_i1::g.54190::m.54190